MIRIREMVSLVICLVSLTGCGLYILPPVQSDVSEQWSEAETGVYRNLLDADLLQACTTGTPDPIPYPAEHAVQEIDCSQVNIVMESPLYSIDKDEFFRVTVTNLNQETSIPIYWMPNVERWNGDEWERLIYLDTTSRMGHDVTTNISIPMSENRSLTIWRDCFITPLSPGKFRTVVYIGYEYQNTEYQKIYAEFELTE